MQHGTIACLEDMANLLYSGLCFQDIPELLQLNPQLLVVNDLKNQVFHFLAYYMAVGGSGWRVVTVRWDNFPFIYEHYLRQDHGLDAVSLNAFAHEESTYHLKVVTSFNVLEEALEYVRQWSSENTELDDRLHPGYSELTI